MAVLAQDLKESVVKFALQGKLTEQLDTDSFAKDLLKNIQSDKIVKKVRKSDKIEPITEDEMFFDIPKKWEWVRLGNIASVIRGLTFSVSYKEQKENTILVLRGGNIDSKTEKLIYNDNIYVEKEIPNENQFLQEGDTLIVASSGTKSSVGKSAYIDNIGENISFGGFMMVVRPNDNICPKFVSYHIKQYRQKIISNTVGLISNITNPILNNLLIPLPPVEEQYRIVAKVEEIMSKIDEYEKIENQLESIKKAFPIDMRDALLQAAMQGKLTEQLDTDSSVDDLIEQIKAEREKLVAEGKIKKSKGKSTQYNDNFVELPEDEYPYDIPDNWKFTNIQNVSYTNGGYAFKSSDYTQEGIRVIRISDFNNNGILNDEIVRYPYNTTLEPFKIKENDILMCMTGGTVGKCCIVKNITEYMATNQRVANISSLGINADFLYFAIKSPFIQKIIQNNKTSTNDNISMDLILSFPIPLPPIEEQQRIVETLDRLLPLCEVL